MPSIIGGLDVHRKQITFDYLDTVTGEVSRGRVAPADREHFRIWLARRFPLCWSTTQLLALAWAFMLPAGIR
jgi:hypothetical protein